MRLQDNNQALVAFFALFILLTISCERHLFQSIGEPPDDVEWIEPTENTIDTTSYYVSTNGNNENSGKSPADAFRTIAYGLERLQPGGTLNIMPGIYSESIGLVGLGKASDSTIIRGFSAAPVLDGQHKGALGLFCEECVNVHIRNLEIRNFTDIGVGATLSSKMSFTDLEVYENGHAVQLKDWELEGYGIHVDDSDDILIANSVFYRNGPDPQINPDYLMGTGINTFGNKNVRILNNKSYRNIGGGILVEDSEEVLVEGNEIYENDLDATIDEWWDGAIWLDGGNNVTIRNNIFRDNLGPGIQISDEDNQSPTGYVLEGNTSIRNYWGIFIWGFGSDNWPDESILKMVDNEIKDNSRDNVWIMANY